MEQQKKKVRTATRCEGNTDKRAFHVISTGAGTATTRSSRELIGHPLMPCCSCTRLPPFPLVSAAAEPRQAAHTAAFISFIHFFFPPFFIFFSPDECIHDRQCGEQSPKQKSAELGGADTRSLSRAVAWIMQMLPGNQRVQWTRKNRRLLHTNSPTGTNDSSTVKK